jgi:uncharacterized protein (DUF2236 family)
MAAVADHSDYRTDPWARLRRTSDFLMTSIFGTTDQARRAAARVRAVHSKVKGFDPVTGTPYRADDPELLLWIHAVEVDSFLAAFQRYGRGLSASETDVYVREMVRAASLVGLQEDAVPGSVAELSAYLEGMDPLLCLTPAAREGMRVVLAPPMPLPARPLWAVPSAAAVAILPARIRALYGLSSLKIADPALRVSTMALFRAMRTLLPPPPPIRAAYERARAAA